MGLFTPKPYKLDGLSGREKTAIRAALEVVLDCTSGSLAGTLKRALRHLKKGALSGTDMAAVLACIEALISAVSEPEEDGMASESKLADTLRPVGEKLRGML